MEFLSREKNLHIISWLVMLGYFLPYFIYGQDLSITIHDNLDSNLVWLKLVIENTTLFSPIDTTIPQIMGGMPLSSLAPVYDPQFFIFKTFGIFNGYVIIRFLMLPIGFYGMRALLTTHYSLVRRSLGEGGTLNIDDADRSVSTQYSLVRRSLGEGGTPNIEDADRSVSSEDADRSVSTQYSLVRRSLGEGGTLITYGVSLCFALLPHWGYNLSIATLPLYFLVLLNIQNRRATKWDYLGLIFIGLTSSLILVSIFVLAGFGLYGLLQWYTKRISPLRLYGALGIISAVSLLSYWRIIAGVLNPSGLPSHRTEFDLLFDWIGNIFSRSNQILIEGQYHAASIHYLFLGLIPLALFLIWKKAKDYKFINAIEFIIISCLWYSIANWSGAAPLISIITDIVPIQLGRLHFIQPLVWYILFALSLFYIAKHTKWGKTAAPILIAAQIVILCFHHEGYTQRDMPSYEAFYATDLFDEVKAYLGPEESVKPCIFISSHPAILQYNGFHTLDGYLADYPLAYKHAFGQIIQGELDKDPNLAKGFNNWGSRAYSMTAQLGKEWIHTKPSPTKNTIISTSVPRAKRFGSDQTRAVSASGVMGLIVSRYPSDTSALGGLTTPPSESLSQEVRFGSASGRSHPSNIPPNQPTSEKFIITHSSTESASKKENSILNTNNSLLLNYNWQAFTNLGGKYIFSPLPINDPNLQHLKTFDHQDAAWTIYLYIVKGVPSTKN